MTVNSQNNEPYKIGTLSPEEKELRVYDKDTTASALYLFENSKIEFIIIAGRIIKRTTYYAKIKIFKTKGYDLATVKLLLYKGKYLNESAYNIKAVTHTDDQDFYLNKENIIEEKINNYWTAIKFTLPKVQEQSIIEYEYITETPLWFNFNWNFQSEIPKLKTRLHAKIPTNFYYHTRLIGEQKPDEYNYNVISNCLEVPGYKDKASCGEFIYTVDNVPAFTEEEYMTSRNNYSSAIRFELSQFQNFNGELVKFTKTWETIDKEIESDPDIGKQFKKTDYITKRIPKKIFAIGDDLHKAKAIYYFITDYFSWDGGEVLFSDLNVKEALDLKVGNSTEINLALANALKSADLKADLILISTRKNGLPTKKYPVLTEFNYSIVKLQVNDSTILLDATDKKMPFGVLPVRCLNSYGRVMNFKSGSYWQDIIPVKNTETKFSLNLNLNDQGNFTGTLNSTYNGYDAVNKRAEIGNVSKERYLDSIENKNHGLVINSYENYGLSDNEKSLNETYGVSIENNTNENQLIFNPFFVSRVSENPFKLAKRTYPVDYAYPRILQYNMTIKIPDNFQVKTLPENNSIELADKGSSYFFEIEQKGNLIVLHSKLSIGNTFYAPETYGQLKEFYNRIIKTQNSLITLEKI